LTSNHSVLVHGVKGDLFVRSVCFSPDGKYLATGAEDKRIRVCILPHNFIVPILIRFQIWDIKAETICRMFEGHQQEVYSVQFSQDSRLIISSSGDKTVRIWNMDGVNLKVLTVNDPSNNEAFTSVAISPNRQLVAAGSLHMVVYIWNVATGGLLERLEGHQDGVYSVAFTQDGKGLVSGGLDKTLKYWDVTGLMSVIKGRKEGFNGSSTSGSEGLADGKDSQCTMNFIGHKVRSHSFVSL